MKHQSKAPLLSVIVPVYNVEPYLRRCLDSLCSQSYSHLEIICVDDGSTDASPDILREYEANDARVRVVSKPNGGLASARNAGLDVATGQWISFVDSDDYLLPGAYRSAMACVNESLGFVHFGVRVEAELGNGLEDILPEMNDYLNVPHEGTRELTPELVYGLAWNVWNKLYRRSVIEQHALRFDEANYGCEDMCFHISYCAYVNEVVYCPERLYAYVLRQNSISFSGGQVVRRLNSYIRTLGHILSVYHEQGLMEAFAPLFAALYQKLDWLIRRDTYLSGAPLAWRARLLEPVGQYGLQKIAGVGAIVHELAEQLRSAQQVLSVLKACARAMPPEAQHEDALSHIAIPVDEAHVGQAALLLHGFRQTAADGRGVCVHFLCDDVTPNSCEQLSRLAGEGLCVRVHQLPHDLLRHLPPLDDAFPHAAYLKMALPDLLPGVGRVLVLSPGMLVDGPLPPFHEVAMGEKPVAVLKPRRAESGDAADAQKAEPYVSCDVLLMDLAAMRERNGTELWVAACMFFPHRFPNAEVDSFNSAFRGFVAELPPSWEGVLRPASDADLVAEAFAATGQHACLPGVPIDLHRQRAWCQPTTSLPELTTDKVAALAPQYKQLCRRYHYYKTMSKLTWGRRKRHYKACRKRYQEALRKIRGFFREARKNMGL